MREDLDDEDIPKCDKAHDTIISAWKTYYLSLKKDLKVFLFFSFFSDINVNVAKASLGRISYTTDIWSSGNRTPYMAVTAHWMAENDGHLELKSALINFQRVWGKHSAKKLANIMLRVLDR